jgi:ribosomal protein S18 acetylase RimI-like enzyme
MQTTVQVLKPEHAREYRALMLEAYAQSPDAFTSTPEERAAEPEAYWTRRIADGSGHSVAFGAYVEEKLVGTAALEFSAKPKTKHKVLLIGMYVSPKARGRGLGKQLIQAAIHFVQARAGTTVITLTVTQGNESAINLYRAAGFAEFGTEPMAILTPSGYKAKVHMWLQVQGEGAAA